MKRLVTSGGKTERPGGGRLYGSALPTHLSFVVDSGGETRGKSGGERGQKRPTIRKSGVVEASRNLKEDVAGVREVSHEACSLSPGEVCAD